MRLVNVKLVIVEQEEGKLFNRGKLLNIGFIENIDKANYFIFHDVDINPQKESDILEKYAVENQEGVIQGIYTSQYETLGGVIKIHKNDFHSMNGFPNTYWGWGVEDRALYNRATCLGKNIVFYIRNCEERRFKYFKVFNDVNDRKHDKDFATRTHYEYNVFNTKPPTEKYNSIMQSGLNNLKLYNYRK
jgi:hypothetical protein